MRSAPLAVSRARTRQLKHESLRPRWKRPLDVVTALAALALAWPLMLLLVLIVRLDSPGPAIFRQERVGLNRERFLIWKFRSMRHGSDADPHRKSIAAWFAGQPAPAGYKAEPDSRVTRVGRWLRRTSLDELPQIFNVLAGNMSMVGPRPAIPYELELYKDTYFERFKVRPGLTGLWQVSGRDMRSAPEMMEMDIQYAREQSIWLDLRILLLSVPAVLGRVKKAGG